MHRNKGRRGDRQTVELVTTNNLPCPKSRKFHLLTFASGKFSLDLLTFASGDFLIILYYTSISYIMIQEMAYPFSYSLFL
uniref:Uncharacterized protein n=1 Tax=Rhizophora mucronata TaxID=61149 RepID=A0A2P2M299_RHIMU